MDTFDKTIKAARDTIKPNQNFVEVTMEQINNQPTSNAPEEPALQKRRFSPRLWLPLSLGLAGVLAIAAVTFTLWRPSGQTDKATVASNSQSADSQNSTSHASYADIDNSINDIVKSIDNESTAQSDISAGLDDNSQQITIPTE